MVVPVQSVVDMKGGVGSEEDARRGRGLGWVGVGRT